MSGRSDAVNGLLPQCRCLTARAVISVLLLACVMTGLSQRALAQSDEVVIRIEVEDRSEDTIDRAAREALEIALLKRSGDRALLQHPAVEAAVDEALHRPRPAAACCVRIERKTRCRRTAAAR